MRRSGVRSPSAPPINPPLSITYSRKINNPLFACDAVVTWLPENPNQPAYAPFTKCGKHVQFAADGKFFGGEAEQVGNSETSHHVEPKFDNSNVCYHFMTVGNVVVAVQRGGHLQKRGRA